jgi:hypothetical protein
VVKIEEGRRSSFYEKHFKLFYFNMLNKTKPYLSIMFFGAVFLARGAIKVKIL